MHTDHIISSQKELSLPDSGLNIINFSSYTLSEDEIAGLRKGLSFCPSCDLDKFKIFKYLQLFIHKLLLKSLYQKQQANTDSTSQVNQALDQLISLLEENDTADLIDRIDLSQVLKTIDE